MARTRSPWRRRFIGGLSRSALFAAFLVITFRTGPLAAEQLLDGIAAVVNDDIITISDVHDEMAPAMAELIQRYKGEALEAQRRLLFKQTLQPLIDIRLQVERAEKLQLHANEGDIDHSVEQLKKENQVSDAEFQEALKSRGMTMASYREQVRQSLLGSRVVNLEVRSRLVIEESELEEAYRQRQAQYSIPSELTVSHILFLAPENGSEEQDESAKEKAAETLADLRAGSDFTTLARERSEGPSAERDGLLGTFRSGELLPGFEEALENLETGEISDLVRTRVGWHIIRLEDRKETGQKPYEEIRETLRAELLRTRSTEKYEEWLESLRRQAYIKILFDG